MDEGVNAWKGIFGGEFSYVVIEDSLNEFTSSMSHPNTIFENCIINENYIVPDREGNTKKNTCYGNNMVGKT